MADLGAILQDPNYVSANPETKAAIFEKHAPTDPNYANANAETQAAIKQKFGLTAGGAATGNPSIAAQGAKALRSGGGMEPLIDIGGATGLGAAFGAASKEILTGAGNVVGSFPIPAARTAGGFLKSAGQLAGAAGRPATAAAGAISGAVGETAGQVVDAASGDSPTALGEATRFIAGGVGPETAKVIPWALRKIGNPTATAAEVIDFIARATGKKENISAAQKAYIEEQIAAIRGAGGKTNEPLDNVGSIMGDEATRIMDSASRQQIAALQQAAGVKVPGAGRPMADVGGDLQGTINKRNEALLKARSDNFEKTEQIRDSLVANQEKNNVFISNRPEYQDMIKYLQKELDNSVAMNHSQGVQAGYKHMIKELTNPDVDSIGLSKPVSFQAVDEVRRKLGDVFRGKPSAGYETIDARLAEGVYARLSDIQRKYAGGPNGPHAQLLDDYAASIPELQKFSSKMGKKATALDQYREGQFINDPSTIPAAYFKTRASVQALKELTGDAAKVNNAALEFANRELAGKDAPAVRTWMGKNSEWLAETPMAQRLVDRYATNLEAAERATRNSADFAARAAKDAALLTREALPAQRAVDLIKSGNTELWAKVTPAIQQSPQAKKVMVDAVRQVVADQATAKTTTDLFSRNIRPFIEGSGIGTRAEMDAIASRLANIQAMNVPEAEKLGIAKRIILQATGGWAASIASRSATNAYQWSRETAVPQ